MYKQGEYYNVIEFSYNILNSVLMVKTENLSMRFTLTIMSTQCCIT